MKHLTFGIGFLTITLSLVLNVACPRLTLGQSQNPVLAIANGREIKQEEVDATIISQVLLLEQQLFAMRRVALENIILTSLLEAEAGKRGVPLEEFRKALTIGKVEVKWADVETAYTENILAFAAMSPDEAKERLRLDLENQERMQLYRQAMKELREKAQVRVFLEEPRLPNVTTNGSPSLGAKRGITIIEFADFHCQHCRDSQGVIKQVLRSYGDEVTLVFKHLPLDVRPQGLMAARAAFCAGEQGRFWQYHDELFTAPVSSADALQGVASKVGLDRTKFSECLGSLRSEEAVLQDKRDAARWDINSTPTYIVNGKILRGAIDFETFKNLIERNLKSSQTTSGP